MTGDVTDRQWRRLQEAISRQSCVLILGPDAAPDPQASENRSLSSTLAKTVHADLGTHDRVVNADDLWHVAQLYLDGRSSRFELDALVRECLAQYETATTDFHRVLAELPFTHIVQLTPDHLMRNALRNAGKNPTKDHYNFKRGSVASVPLPNPSVQTPLLYSLLGTVDEPDSMVLTETDLLDYFAASLSSAPPIADYICKRFQDKTTCLLFVGFGFGRWPARVLLRALKTRVDGGERSLALDGPAATCSDEHAMAAVFVDHVHQIEFQPQSPFAFAQQLRARYKDSAVARQSVPEATAGADAPHIFLCYTSDDLDRVQDLQQCLERAGFTTWRDKQSLRGGDNWQKAIQQVIGKQINYFVVCASTALSQRAESYCFHEIDVALERQKSFQGFRFVIPAQFDPGVSLSVIPTDLHYVSSATDPEHRDLIASIQEDWAKRHKHSGGSTL